jgi:DNA (cytosine-5)-methyltransferase 1
MKVLSLFSGIGAFEKALCNLGIPYELVGYCEIDKYASKSYSAIHGCPEAMNLGDITKVDEKALPNDIDLITYGFPCQDISLAGKQKGLFNEDGTQTRSGLFFEALRIIEETKPRVAIAENVKNLVGKKFNAQFQVVLASLEVAGYNNYYKVLNAKDFGVPQNRERVFIVSIRKDIESTFFHFPEGFPLEKRLRDVLEAEVDEKFYLSDKMVDYLADITIKNKARGNGNVYVPTNPEGVAKTITTKEGQRVKDNFIEDNPFIGTITDGSSPKHNNRVVVWDGFNQRVRADQSCVGTLTQNCGADLKRNGQGIIEMPCSTRGSQVASTIRASIHKQGSRNIMENIQSGLGYEGVMESALRIRKLTPKECYRLMGFDDEDFAKAEAVVSNTQLYKQAGNSIVVPVVEHIIEALLNCGALK